jgi:hypothetical protein
MLLNQSCNRLFIYLEVLLDGRIFKNIIIQTILIVLFLFLVSFFLINKNFSVGLLIGGLISAINFGLLLFVVKKIFFGEPKTQIIYAILFMFKLSVIGGVIFWLFSTKLFILNKAGFLAGITVLFLTITINALLYGGKLKAEVN